jgi:hypothetical protein
MLTDLLTPIDNPALAIPALILIIPTALYGFVKSPLWGWILTPILRHRKERKEWWNRVERLEIWVDNMDERMDSFEHAIAPTNGDKRSISDRLDTVKYQGKVHHANHVSLALWLQARHPEAEPLTVLPLPER